MKPSDQSSPSALTTKLGELCFTFVFLVVVMAVLTGIGWVLFQAFRGLVWTVGVAESYIGAIGWNIAVPLVALAIYETVSRFKPNAAAAQATGEPGPNAAKPSRGRTRGLLCAGSAAVIMSGNLCLNIAAARIDAHWQSRQQHTTEIYKNHDLAKLVGQCIRLAILRHADFKTTSGDFVCSAAERSALQSIAKIAPEQWAAMTDDTNGKKTDERVRGLANSKLTQFIQDDEAAALHEAKWASLLTDWRKEANATALTPETLQASAKTIAADFGITLREALKADFEKGGKAWAAMQLDIAQQLLNRTPLAMEKSNPEIKAALLEVKGLLADDAKAIDALNTIISDVRQSQEAHAVAVEANFDEVVGRLQRLQIDVTVIKEVTAETKGDVKVILTNQAIDAKIELISRNKTLTDEQKEAQVTPLLQQKIANAPAQGPREPTSPAAQAAVRDIFKDAPKLVRFAALARVGLDKEADELAAEIDRTTAGLSDADKYEFFVARGDRYWNASDFWNSATWYAQAMAIRVDDPAVVHRAARSAILAPGKPTYTRDVQLAQSWVERAIAKLAKQPDASVLDTARLHATLATTLLYQGKSSASITPAREALRLLERENDTSAGQAYAVLVDAAEALQYAGVLPEAAAIDRAVTAAEAFAGPRSGAAALALSSRASIRRLRGDLAGAEADIKQSIDWGEAQSPRDERSLAIDYASRASIRRLRGDLAGAEADIKNSIDWGEAQSPRDERSLAIWYASRARIRQHRGDLAGAEADLKKSIDWYEAQSPRNERSLAVYYASRASIRQDRGDLAGAEADIKKSIDWYEAQSPRDERGLAIDYAWRASIRQNRGDLAGAEADIQKSIDWYEAQSPRDERGLAIRYASRASIRQNRGDLAGAEADIQKSIDWYEAQSPRDERGLAIRYASRARIREAQAIAARKAGDANGAAAIFAKAKADITAALAWWEKYLPNDERGLGILRQDRARIDKAARGE